MQHGCMSDSRRTAPAAERNREPIEKVLRRLLPQKARIFEVASGTGVHAVAFAQAHPKWVWQTSDVHPEALASLRSWSETEELPNLPLPLEHDVSDPTQAFPPADAVVAINLVHISLRATAPQLFAKAKNCLGPEGLLFLYGPYKVNGNFTSEGNRRFHESLKDMHPEFGLWDLEEIQELGEKHGFTFQERVNMPANNFSLVFTRNPLQETPA